MRVPWQLSVFPEQTLSIMPRLPCMSGEVDVGGQVVNQPVTNLHESTTMSDTPTRWLLNNTDAVLVLT